ncbi:helix-turn-helix domain-containing protein [Arthrobacter agilis]|uniref:helix-turn-helix transcriptional regulator n=1 Tax=Arthrobacter agilis TaxID=37921 RepID=UPI000B34F839|nr:ArsR family transcriptional regulator [Arthrobacter agilis]PPB47426.1 ArsR family transcriptional regulator [Arthrobacter agilis]TPV22782.1 helix-turn-helix domain-containing protein [Arthrobacter agilis]VDR32031.1 iron-sulfur cluster biosynthesis transcriptional regulator SufR [Arthrobacter agilis]
MSVSPRPATPDRTAQIVSPDPDERTRDRVLAAVLERGPVSAAELGDTLGFTPAAMRRHLDALSGDGLIEVKRARSSAAGAGRPARRYVLSQRGQARMGNDYLDIATAALVQLGEAAGPAAIEEFARTRFSGMEERYRPIVEAAGPELEDRAGALAAALSADGFVGSTKTVGPRPPRAPRPLHTPVASPFPSVQAQPGRPVMLSVQLCQGHCPIQELASAFPAFCEQETRVFSRLLGVDVRRLSTLAAGGHVCTTHIPLGRTTAAPAAPVTPDAPGDAAPAAPPGVAPPSHPATSSIHQQGRP